MPMIIAPVGEGEVAARPRRAIAEQSRSRLFGAFWMPALLGSRTVLAPTNLVSGSYAAFGLTLIWADADIGNGNRFASTGKELLIARNTSGAALTVTVLGASTSTTNRTQNQLLRIEAGDTAAFGPFPTNGWKQADSCVWVNSESTSIRLSVLTLP